jgi:signal transduction histidine kinase
LVTDGELRRLPADVELGLYRIVQEALNNAKRHAGVTQASVAVAFLQGRVTVTVADDGRGFVLPGRMTDLVAAGRFGLVGMEESAHLVHNQLTVQSHLNPGTIISVNAPA